MVKKIGRLPPKSVDLTGMRYFIYMLYFLQQKSLSIIDKHSTGNEG